MELSAEILKKTLARLRSDPGKGVAERRVHPRVGLRCRLRIVVVQDAKVGPAYNVWARDISQGGIGVVCAKRIQKGKRFVIRLPRDDDDGGPLSVLCTVCNCRELADDMFLIGAMFEGREIQTLMTPEFSPA